MITDEERTKLEIHTKRWIDIAYQTGRTNQAKLTHAIQGMYESTEQKRPVVEIVPSPRDIAKQIAKDGDYTKVGQPMNTIIRKMYRTIGISHKTLSDEVYLATYKPASIATQALFHPIDRAMLAICPPIAHSLWYYGNVGIAGECRFTGCRDVLGLELPGKEFYCFWEQAAIFGGYRLMLPDLCIVSDFPDRICVDRQWRPHCDSGPSHRWSDGWELWHLDGIQVDEQLVLRPKTQTLQQIDGEHNEDLKTLRISRFGWPEYLGASGAQLVDERQNFVEGTREALYRQRSGHLRLVVTCPTGRHPYALGVGDNHIVTCEQAQNWLAGEKPFRTLART